MKNVILIALMAVFVTSCMTTKTAVGDYNSDPGKSLPTTKENNFEFFGGLYQLADKM